MRRYDFVEVKESQLVELTCSICKKDLLADEMERQESFHLSQTGGYSSIFGDGVEVYIDICQHCFKKILGKYCTVI